MKKYLLTAFIAGMAFTSTGQMADFETPLNYVDTAWFGQDQVSDGDTIFNSGGLVFENNYNASWGSFSGWAYSNSIDVTTPGYSNQFSAITEGGAEGSGQFGICYASGNKRVFGENGESISFMDVHVTNTTYAYLSMRDGDMFSKKFGDSTDANGALDGTNGEDWFLLTFYGLGIDSTRTGDSVNFYLADFRFSDNAQDYIVEDWAVVDLSSLGLVYGLDFELSSSDQGTWGMNTPGYFAMDNLRGTFASLPTNNSLEFNLYPNPAAGSINIEAPIYSTIELLEISGKIIYSISNTQTKTTIDIEGLASGIYVVQVRNGNNSTNKKLVKP